MVLKRFGTMLLAALLVLSLLPAAALAARNETRVAEEMDMPAIIESKDADGTVNVYHWWTAGGEKDAIESVVDGFSNISAGFVSEGVPCRSGCG